MIAARNGRERMAVHVRGHLGNGQLPVICIAGYERNMADYADFAALLPRLVGDDQPVVLVDLLGRGRSEDRARAGHYVSVIDAGDIAAVAAALGIEQAILVGQGYGGQVIMALAAERPGLIAGAVLIDAGPVSDTRGLVRLYNNLTSLAQVRGEAAARVMQRRIMTSTYPGISDARADALAQRTHYLDRSGRQRPLFDRRLVKALSGFTPGDVLVAQWPMFGALARMPLMLFRTQLSDQLRRETFEEMMRRRPDATALIINGEGAPALLDHEEEVGAVAEFVTKIRGDRVVVVEAEQETA
jgi:pimeloyl-ACP methyl ester carboxylesterase